MHYTRGLTDKTNMDFYALTHRNRHDTGNEEDCYRIGGRYYGIYNDAISFDTELAYQFGQEDDTDMDIRHGCSLQKPHTPSQTSLGPLL
jgi:hypothetical protein